MVFHSFAHVLLLLLPLLLPIELQYLTNRNTNKHEILHACVFYSGNVHNSLYFR